MPGYKKAHFNFAKFVLIRGKKQENAEILLEKILGRASAFFC